ncbi:MAG: hypothetical protein WB607_23150 [Candidatus Acidiferrum sp.]
MKRANAPAKRKDLLAAGHASESYGNSSIKTTQDEWDRIFGPTPSPRKVAKRG